MWTRREEYVRTAKEAGGVPQFLPTPMEKDVSLCMYVIVSLVVASTIAEIAVPVSSELSLVCSVREFAALAYAYARK